MKPAYGKLEANLMDDYYAPNSAPSLSLLLVSPSKESEEDGYNNQFLVTLPECKVSTPHIMGIHINQY